VATDIPSIPEPDPQSPAVESLLAILGRHMSAGDLLDIASCQDGPRQPVADELQATLVERRIGHISSGSREAIAGCLFGSRRIKHVPLLFCGVVLLEDAIQRPTMPSTTLVGSLIPRVVAAAFQMGIATVVPFSVWLRAVVDRVPQHVDPTEARGVRTLVCLGVLTCDIWVVDSDTNVFESVHSAERLAIAKWESHNQVPLGDRVASPLDLDPYLSTRDDWIRLWADVVAGLGRSQQIISDISAEVQRR